MNTVLTVNSLLSVYLFICFIHPSDLINLINLTYTLYISISHLPSPSKLPPPKTNTVAQDCYSTTPLLLHSRNLYLIHDKIFPLLNVFFVFILMNRQMSSHACTNK